jgi:hypothetical protein
MTWFGFAQALRSFSQRRPFLPYRIEFIIGAVIRVSHPEAVRMRSSVVIHVSPSGKQRLFDFTSVCQFLDGEELTLSPPQPSAEA